jgi:hypothetical protein
MKFVVVLQPESDLNNTYAYTPTPCYLPVCFTPFYCNTPCHFTPLLNLNCLIFCLTPFGWLCSFMLTLCFWWEYNFLFMPTFSGMQLQHTTRAGWLKVQSLPYRNTLCLYYEDQPVMLFTEITIVYCQNDQIHENCVGRVQSFEC